MLLLAAAGLALVEDVPAGTRLQVRLTAGVSSRTDHTGDPISAVLVVDAPVNGRAVAFGSVVRGVVGEATPFAWRSPQATLRLEFRELIVGGQTIPLSAKVIAVDNARETVDASGRILGIAPPGARPSTAEDMVLWAALMPEVFVLETAEYRVREEERPDILYQAGVDLTLETLTPTRNVPVVSPEVPGPIDAALSEIVAAQPIRTMAGSPRRPGDLINLLFVGTESQIAAAFQEAGWSTAVALSLRSDVRTVLAVAEDRGYQIGPVSQEWVDGKPPDLVFQKQNDTFAKRHHVRVWARPATWQGRPVWIAAATHDIGVKFVRQERTFTHQVDSRIDLERQKILDDLRFTRAFQPATLVDRPSVPQRTENATLDLMETDGRIAVMIARELP
jgi:hypothetical protein